jgi:hypothetical protein
VKIAPEICLLEPSERMRTDTILPAQRQFSPSQTPNTTYPPTVDLGSQSNDRTRKTMDPETNNHYVYLLVDPRCNSVFYVGQGIGMRAGDHEAETLARSSGGVLSDKHERIRDIEASGKKVRIDYLRVNLSKREADLVEGSAIDALHPGLTNKIRGVDGGKRIQSVVFDRVARSVDQVFPHKAVVVGVKGVISSVDELGGLVDADHELVKANAIESWAVSTQIRNEISNLGATDLPVLLVALQAGSKLRYAKRLVVGLWEVVSCEESSVKVSRKNGGNGCRFVVSDQRTKRVDGLLGQYLHNRLTTPDGKPINPNVDYIKVNWK